MSEEHQENSNQERRSQSERAQGVVVRVAIPRKKRKKEGRCNGSAGWYVSTKEQKSKESHKFRVQRRTERIKEERGGCVDGVWVFASEEEVRGGGKDEAGREVV